MRHLEDHQIESGLDATRRARELVADLRVHHSALVWHDDNYTFVHRALFELSVAEVLREQPPERTFQVVSRWREPEWRMILDLYAEGLDGDALRSAIQAVWASIRPIDDLRINAALGRSLHWLCVGEASQAPQLAELLAVLWKILQDRITAERDVSAASSALQAYGGGLLLGAARVRQWALEEVCARDLALALTTLRTRRESLERLLPLPAGDLRRWCAAWSAMGPWTEVELDLLRANYLRGESRFEDLVALAQIDELREQTLTLLEERLPKRPSSSWSAFCRVSSGRSRRSRASCVRRSDHGRL
ncbi:MAG: hypothetical protein IPK80_27775 [Nannocystis sp.]|nr:hypothetical protein [Nannocystis sp.]